MCFCGCVPVRVSVCVCGRDEGHINATQYEVLLGLMSSTAVDT